MTKTPGVWGIDLGQCALKAVRLEEIDGQMTATAFDYVEHPKILSQPDADPDQLTREALEKFLSRNSLRGDTVAISVPGQSGLARFVKLPPVEEKKIADIVRFEAKQQIPFNLEEVVWDYQRIGAGEVDGGFAMNIEIGLFAMKRDMIGRYLQHFKDVGVEIHVVQMAPLALCNYVAYDLLGKGARVKDEEETKTNCVVALDIGADSSNLVITDADRVIWQRPIPLGGNHFTRALTKELKLTFAKAEHLKRNAMKSPDLKKILTALKPVLNDFVGEVQRSLGYFTNTHRDAQIEYMVGLGNAFRLPGLQRYLGEKLQLEVRKLGKMERLSGEAVLTQPTFSENVLTFGVAYGLALQGLKQTRLMTNLLPSELHMERLVRGKKPWAVAAAALLLLGTGALVFKSYREAHVYANPEVTTALSGADAQLKVVADADKNYTEAVKSAQKEENAVRSIVAGAPEYKNWLELTKYVCNCLPQPNGDNVPEAFKGIYMHDLPSANTHPPGLPLMSGDMAFKALNDRLAGKTPGGETLTKNDFTPGIDDLVQINVQSFDARFSDDLAGFWETCPSESKLDENVRPKEQAKKGPEGKGWIVEIQGFTYHHRGVNFVRDTLLETLAAKSVPPPEAAKPDTGKPDPKVPPGKEVKDPKAPPTGKDKEVKDPKAPPTAPTPAPTGKDVKDTKAPSADSDIPATGPVLNRISHVMLFKKQTTLVKTPEAPGALKSRLAELAKATRTDMGGAAPAPPPGAPAPGGTKPAGPPATTTTTPPPQVSAGGGGLGTSLRDSWAPLGSIGAVTLRSGTGAPPPVPKGDVPDHVRTDFIIVFVWREPTPSAALRGEEKGPDEGGGATAPPKPR